MSLGTTGLCFSTSFLFSVKDKVAVVSEGCSGTGIAVATALVQNGAKVYIVSQLEATLQSIKEQLNENEPGQCEYIVADLKASPSKAGCVSLGGALKKLESKLDILVNNSGATWGGKWEEFPDEGWDQTMASHVKSLLYGKFRSSRVLHDRVKTLHCLLVTGCLTGLLAKGATASEPGRIINIPTVAQGDIEDPREERLNLNYDTSKSAVSHLTAVLSTSLALKSINVNAILPDIEIAQITNAAGATISEAFNTAEHLDSARDLAGVLMFLVSLGGARVTGARIEAERIGGSTTNRWWGKNRPSMGGV